MKKILVFALFGILSTAALFADDFLSRVTGGNLSDNSKGVISLNDDEMKKVVGGYYYSLIYELSNQGNVPSLAFAVWNQNGTALISRQETGLNDGELLTAHVRKVGGRLEFYLEVYRADYSHTAYAGKAYNKVLDNFKAFVSYYNIMR